MSSESRRSVWARVPPRSNEGAVDVRDQFWLVLRAAHGQRALPASRSRPREIEPDVYTRRIFTPQDEDPDSAPIVLLSRGFWQTRYGGEPDVIGKTIRVDGQPREIVGVMPASLRSSSATG